MVGAGPGMVVVAGGGVVNMPRSTKNVKKQKKMMEIDGDPDNIESTVQEEEEKPKKDEIKKESDDIFIKYE